ncbi:MAG: fatty acid desaturase [Alphaproteobacteria bacterium]
MTSISPPRPARESAFWLRLEAPTWLLCVAIYGGWFLLTVNFRALPWWVVLPLGAWLVAWHNSLQHEIVHGHPTRRRWLNETLAYPPLGLVMAYPVYRTSHLTHHAAAALTCPRQDPESYYVGAADWRKMSLVLRLLLTVNNSMLGRFIIGPAISYYLFWRGARLRRSELLEFAAHAGALGAVLWWTIAICGIPFWAYFALFAYPGMSLTLMRSYLEHRPAGEQAGRTAIVERAPLFGLLFLNNNLHALHHDQPFLPWYALPAAYRNQRSDVLARNGGYVFAGYLDVARRYLLKPKDSPAHPG